MNLSLKRLLVGLIAIILFLGLPGIVRAACSLSFTPRSGSFALGSYLSVRVVVTTGGEAINAASAFVSYPTDKLVYVRTVHTSSIFPVWVEPDASGGIVRLNGGVQPPGFTGTGTIGTIVFRVNATGNAALSFTGGSHILTNRSNSDIINLGSLGAASYTLVKTLPTGPKSTAGPTVKISTAPIISAITVGNVGTTSVTITWTTDRNTDSAVEYGVDAGVYPLSTADNGLTENHSVLLTDLSAATRYFFRIKSVDAAGNLGVSGDEQFITSPPSPVITPPVSGNQTLRQGLLRSLPVVGGAMAIFGVFLILVSLAKRKTHPALRRSMPPPGSPPPFPPVLPPTRD
jgi:hypothetical protein